MTKDGTTRYREYLRAVHDAQLENPKWRRGQTYFNVLYRLDPALGNYVRGGPNDPFHDDGVLDAFLTMVRVHWGAGEGGA